MFAINDRLQEYHPDFARALREDESDVRLPPDLALRLALTSGPFSRIGGPVFYMKVEGVRTFHFPLADVWYPPLAWCLASTRTSEPSLGPELTSRWADVSSWLRYDEAYECDLRSLVGSLAVSWLPRFGAEEWVVLTSHETLTALEGRAA